MSNEDIKHTNYNVMKSSVDGKINPTMDEIKNLNSFFLVRYISNDPVSIYIANALNCYPKIPIYAQYKFIRYSTLDKVAFISYPKKEFKMAAKDMRIICNHFNINETIAKDYIKILGDERTEEIIKKYKNFK